MMTQQEEVMPLTDVYCYLEMEEDDSADARITIGRLRDVLAALDHHKARADELAAQVAVLVEAAVNTDTHRLPDGYIAHCSTCDLWTRDGEQRVRHSFECPIRDLPASSTALMERIARLSPEGIQKFANKACQWLCELPDRTSPEDWPEACLVEPQELHDYLVEQLTELSIAQADKGREGER